MAYEVEVKGEVLSQSSLAQMTDMLRYDGGDVVETTTMPVEGKPWKRFTAMVHLRHYTPARWRSFGLGTHLMKRTGFPAPEPRFYSQDEVSRFISEERG